MTVSLNLLELRENMDAVIKTIEGGQQFVKKLSAMGITPGRGVVKEGGHSGGPVIIHVCGSRLAIGRGMASKITVEISSDASKTCAGTEPA